MTDHSTPNLPSRDFSATSAFYARLGFEEGWRDDGWMILKRGDLSLEFFPHPELDPLTSWFSCCLRLDNLDAFYALAKAGGAFPKRPLASRAFTRRTSRIRACGLLTWWIWTGHCCD